MSTSTCTFLITNGVVFRSSDSPPPVATFLEAHPGAYTTTRSDGGGSHLLFWERHLRRLCESVRILSTSHPRLLFGAENCRSSDFSRPLLDSEVRSRVADSLGEILPIAMAARGSGEEMAVTVLVAGNLGKPGRVGDVFDVHVHVGSHKPLVFGVRENGAKLAVVGRRREAAEAKYSDWVRVRKGLEKLRPPGANELLLSNDGDGLLEGSVSNFFVVCRKDKGEAKGMESMDCFEVQTAPVRDGTLPGIIRQLVSEICLAKGIPFREVAPSWSEREVWEEAFITNSLRLIQHVELISIPNSWDSLLHAVSWKDISWDTIQFQQSPGMITRTIQRELMEKAALEGYTLRYIL